MDETFKCDTGPARVGRPDSESGPPGAIGPTTDRPTSSAGTAGPRSLVNALPTHVIYDVIRRPTHSPHSTALICLSYGAHCATNPQQIDVA